MSVKISSFYDYLFLNTKLNSIDLLKYKCYIFFAFFPVIKNSTVNVLKNNHLKNQLYIQFATKNQILCKCLNLYSQTHTTQTNTKFFFFIAHYSQYISHFAQNPYFTYCYKKVKIV